MREEAINRGLGKERGRLAKEHGREDEVEGLGMEITLIFSVVRKCPLMERIPEPLGASKETWVCKNTFAEPDDDNGSLSHFLSQVCCVSVRTDDIISSTPVEPSAADKPAEDICTNVILDVVEGGSVPSRLSNHGQISIHLVILAYRWQQTLN